MIVSVRACDNFKKKWFASLLRQDAAFHDVHSVSGMATALSAAANKIKRGLGAKLGQGIQFGTTFVGGIVYSFWSSWKVALVILALLPVVSFAAFVLMQLNQNQTVNAQKVSDVNVLDGWILKKCLSVPFLCLTSYTFRRIHLQALQPMEQYPTYAPSSLSTQCLK